MYSLKIVKIDFLKIVSYWEKVKQKVTTFVTDSLVASIDRPSVPSGKFSCINYH